MGSDAPAGGRATLLGTQAHRDQTARATADPEAGGHGGHRQPDVVADTSQFRTDGHHLSPGLASSSPQTSFPMLT